nr:hypothetical protein [Tanacetum cinerariifolium]
MANLSEDIQCAGFDTRPPMLDRTEFASWKQRIRLYCRGKENEVSILKSIDEGPFQMGTFRETLTEGNEGSLHRVYSDLSPDDKDRFTKLINDMRNIKMTMPRMQLNSKFVNNMLPEWGRLNVHGRHNKGQGNNPRGTCAAGNEGIQNRAGNANPCQARQIKCYNCNGIGHIAKNCTQPKRPQNLDYFKDKMLLMQAQENGMVLDEEQLLFLAGGHDTAVDEDVDEPPVQDLELNVDNLFQFDKCDAFDSDVDEGPTA